MYQALGALVLIAIHSSRTFADILGPVSPSPVDLSSDVSLVPAAWGSISSVLDGYFNGSLHDDLLAQAFLGAENVTFSIGAFSLNDQNAIDALQYHHTSRDVIENDNGTDKADVDSIYVLASITKVFTVFSGLIELTEEQWNRPLTQCVPGLAEYVAQLATDDPIMNTEWNRITPWALANQIAGVAEQPPQLDVYIQSQIPGSEAPSHLGLPPAPKFESQTTCVVDCPSEAYAESVQWYHSTWLPWSTPLYSNNGFILLGIALSNLTGKSMSEVFGDAVLSTLNLRSTFAGPPKAEADIARSVITTDAYFFADTGIFISSGGIYSTVRDLATFGRAVLNSTLLSPEATRKWLKPTSHTGNLNYSVGAPWEIVRYTSPLTGKVIDLYSKSGESGDANTHFVLIPDYNAGFSYLSAATNVTIGASIIGPILDLVTANLLRALEAQAAAEATANFAGTYTSTNASLNSSVVISYNETTTQGTSAALSISRWISNGTDALTSLFSGVQPRLYMSIQDQRAGKVAFYASPTSSVPSGPFTGTLATNGDWIYMDVRRYGGVALGLFVFEVDEAGRATAVMPAVTNVTLQREDN